MSVGMELSYLEKPQYEAHSGITKMSSIKPLNME